LWGPKNVEIIIDNESVRLEPGDKITARAIISVAFNENLEVPLYLTTYEESYPKFASVPPQEITVRSPYVMTESTVQLELGRFLVTGFLFGGIVWVGWVFINVFSSVPRIDSRLPSGFCDRKTARAIGRIAAYKIVLSILMGFVFFFFTQLGTAQYQINFARLITETFLGRLDVELLSSIALWIGGSILRSLPK
jgi:hypothetical protein